MATVLHRSLLHWRLRGSWGLAAEVKNIIHGKAHLARKTSLTSGSAQACKGRPCWAAAPDPWGR